MAVGTIDKDVKYLPGTIRLVEGESLVHTLDCLGGKYSVTVVPRDGKSTGFYVSPVPPDGIKPKILEIIKARFGYDKTPIYGQFK